MKSHPVHVASEVHAALQKLKQEWGCASISEVVRRLLAERALVPEAVDSQEKT